MQRTRRPTRRNKHQELFQNPKRKYVADEQSNADSNVEKYKGEQ
jgi:hypothetical protein